MFNKYKKYKLKYKHLKGSAHPESKQVESKQVESKQVKLIIKGQDNVEDGPHHSRSVWDDEEWEDDEDDEENEDNENEDEENEDNENEDDENEDDEEENWDYDKEKVRGSVNIKIKKKSDNGEEVDNDIITMEDLAYAIIDNNIDHKWITSKPNEASDYYSVTVYDPIENRWIDPLFTYIRDIGIAELSIGDEIQWEDYKDQYMDPNDLVNNDNEIEVWITNLEEPEVHQQALDTVAQSRSQDRNLYY